MSATPLAMPVEPSIEPPLVVFDRVTRTYGALRAAVSDVNLKVGRREFVLLVGPSGAGKSTLLRLAAGLETPSSGSVLVGNEDLSRLRRRARIQFRRSVGIVLQDLMLLDDRSVLDNVLLPALVAGLTQSESERRAQAALSRVGLQHLPTAQLRSFELSGGEQQRVALARAIVNRPALLIVDEPTAHLDSAAAADLLLLLEQFSISGVTVLMASNGETVPAPGSARVVSLREGKLG